MGINFATILSLIQPPSLTKQCFAGANAPISKIVKLMHFIYVKHNSGVVYANIYKVYIFIINIKIKKWEGSDFGPFSGRTRRYRPYDRDDRFAIWFSLYRTHFKLEKTNHTSRLLLPYYKKGHFRT